jgi:outer membrane protein assembly factor BamB
MKKGWWFLFTGVACFWGLTSETLSADWPQWRGPQRDGKVQGFSVPAAWPAELKPQWSVSVGQGVATPALVGDRLYLFTRQDKEEVILCLDALTGKELWSDRYEAVAVTGAPGRFPGPRSSPAVAEGRVVTLGVGGVLSCLNAEDGKLLWRKDPYSGAVLRFFTAVSPLIADGMAIVQVGKEDNGGILALELETGQVRWQWTQDGPAYASPVLMNVEGVRQLVAFTQKKLVGLSLSDGKLLWELPFPPLERSYNSVSPIVDGQTVIYSGAQRGTFAVRVEKNADGFSARPLWENKETAAKYNTPVLHQGFLFGLSDTGYLFCLNASDGSLAWKGQTQYDRGGFGAIVDAGSVLMFLSPAGELIVFEPDPKEFRQTAAYKVSPTQTYAHPVLSGNRIYIKDQENLTLWTLE